ncbi:hypothetical protein AB4084_35555, partial [Lysobacter sp. 2RAB21]
LKIVKSLEVGDLIYIPGHVMMVVGHEDGWPYVIHDTTGITFRDRTGDLTRVHLNGVSVTPLVPLLFNRKLRDVPQRRLRNFDILRLALNHLA